MAYNSNNKTYTDHPLMDEICYACKNILKGIVVKNDVLANECETDDSMTLADMYMTYREVGYISFALFTFTYDILVGFGYDSIAAKDYVGHKDHIPAEDRDALTEYGNQYFKDNFEEQNDYYRSLMGLPPYGTPEDDYIYLEPIDIPTEYDFGDIDFSIPLHLQPDNLLAVLQYNGTIDSIREDHKGSKYSYILHLGPRSIDLYDARKARKWDILYMPNVQYQIENRFTDLYIINRDTYETKTYQEFYAQAGEYYDQMMILLLLCQTFADLVVDTPEWYIRKDIFDIRSCQYFLDSSGVKFFKQIPLRYQIRIVKNLNRLIKYKSSNQNFEDILDVFDIPNTKIYKYWLFKKILPGDEPGKEEMDLEFIASEVNESYDDYIKDNIYRTPYDDITLQDKYWDGELSHEKMKEQILKRPFTIQGTKYMSIELNVPIGDVDYQMGYALGLMMDTKVYEGLKDYRIAVPSIDEFGLFSIPDLFLMLEILSLGFYTTGTSTSDIRIPDMSEGPEPKITNECKWILDWKVKTFPEMYVKKNGRVLGFNNTLDKQALIDTLSKRHSFKHTRFGLNNEDIGGPTQSFEEYKASRASDWIHDIGVYDFIIPDETITDLDRYKEVYENNTKIYNNLKEMIVNADDQDDKKYLEYAMQEMFTKPYDKYVKVVGEETIDYTNLVDLLRDRSFILYRVYKDIMAEGNLESRQDLIRTVVNDIVDTLEYYLSEDGFEYLFSFTATESFEAIIMYLYLMITFFKSFKVQFLDPYYTFDANDKLENYAGAIDNVKEWNERKWTVDKQFHDDHIGAIDEYMYFNEFDPRDETYEYTDIFAHYDPDPFLDLDIDGLNAARGETEETVDIDGGTDKEVAPYVMLNGGFAYQGMVDFSIFDGGDADEAYETYYIVDGGGAFHEDVFHTDEMGSTNFNYMIDGGGSAKRYFENNSGDIKLVGTEFFLNFKVSERDSDAIEIKEDGIYISQNAFVLQAEFVSVQSDLNRLVAEMEYGDQTFEETVKLLTDQEYRENMMRSLSHNILKDIETAVEAMTDDKIKHDLIRYIDSMNNMLRSYEKTNPYAWADL